MRKLLFPTVFALISLAILISLGTWQLQRHSWKKGVLDQISKGIQAKAVSYSDWQESLSGTGIRQFDKVRFSGSFKHEDTVFAHAIRGGRLGFQVFTPLQLSSGQLVFVNRGFIFKKHSETMDLSGITTLTDIEGFIRLPEVKSYFTPEPNLKTRVWYSVDINSMKEAIKSSNVEAGYYIELFSLEEAKKWPIVRNPKDYLTSIPNRHFEYALTWYGLALALICVYMALAWSITRRST